MKFLKSGGKIADKSDEELLNDYRSTNNLALLAQLYQKYMHLVYGVCLKYLKDEDDAKDAVMQIFEQLVDKVLKHEIKQFKSWLYVLSRNYCLMQLRAGKKMEVQSLDMLMEFADDFHHDTNLMDEDIEILERCKEKLPDAQKISVELFYNQEKCYKDIAAETGFTLNEVKSYIQNGKRNLKNCIEKNREA